MQIAKHQNLLIINLSFYKQSLLLYNKYIILFANVCDRVASIIYKSNSFKKQVPDLPVLNMR